MMKTILLATACAVLAACAHTEPVRAAPEPKTARPGGEKYLDAGPTIALGGTNDAGKSTLELLDERKVEVATLQERITDLESALQEAQGEVATISAEREEVSGEAGRLRSLLEGSLDEQHTLTDQLLMARIERLRTERQMLELKLADLARDAQ